MKTAIRLTALALAAAMLAAAMLGCTPVNGAHDDLGDIERHEVNTSDVKLDSELAAAAAKLGTLLLREVYAAGEKESVLVSPVSVLTALGMLDSGTTGKAAEEMAALLGISAEELNLLLCAFEKTMTEQLKSANSVWIKNDDALHLEKDYLQTLADYYDTSLYRVPFDEGTVRDVNAWCSDKTDGMIREIVKEFSPETVMLLINALCFDAKWSSPFERESQEKKGFTNKSGAKEDWVRLSSTEGTYLSLTDGTAGFVKPYEGGNYAFAAILPPEDADFDAYVDGFTAEKWASLWEGREDGLDVHVSLPKFTKDTFADLTEILQEAGIPSVFDPCAEPLSGIGTFGGGALYVSSVLHKTHIELKAEGTRAAAVTVIEMTCTSCEPPDLSRERNVICDRPFLYAIVDTATGTPLFFGCVTSVAD